MYTNYYECTVPRTHTHSIGSGSWETDGVAMMSQEWSADNKTLTITCNATHLTSFAVLVDLSGTLDAGVSLVAAYCMHIYIVYITRDQSWRL